MSKEKWSDAKTRNFISNYIKQTSLWNVSDPDYAIKSKVNIQSPKDTEKGAQYFYLFSFNFMFLQKEKGYKCLQDEFGLSLNEVKNKIRIYRTTYGQELKKMETTNTPPKVKYFIYIEKKYVQIILN